MSLVNGVPVSEIMNSVYREMETAVKELGKTLILLTEKSTEQPPSPGDLFEEMLASFKKNDQKAG
jgi:hypothetical protein